MGGSSLYLYREPSPFLKAAWLSRQEKNSRFTIRAWSSHLGIRSHSAFYEVVMGKRKTPKSYVPLLSKFFSFSEKERVYFEMMVDFSRARTESEKIYFGERLQELAKKSSVHFKEIDNYIFLKSPLHSFIAELVLQKDFKPRSAWIQSRLKKKYSIHEIDEAIDRLVKLGILEKDEFGGLVRVDRYVSSKSDFTSAALREAHKSLMALARDAIEEQSVLEREFQAMAMNVDPEKMPEMKERIRKFINEFTAEFDTPKCSNEELYQLNFQFFKLSQSEGEISNA